MPERLLERRLHFVVGKGGVGKTTVAAALALLLARRGRRTLAIEMDPAGRLATVLGRREGGYAPAEVAPGLHVMAVDGRAALEEYLGLIIPVRRLLSTVFSSTVYQYFVAVAPGLKELMTVGKTWYEAVREERGRPLWDAIVVDAAATGHSLQYLRMPQAARETFGAGLVQREATKIVDLLQDRRTTAVHLVTLAEEMPVAETLETRAQLEGGLGFPLGWVVVNRLHRRRFAAPVLARLDAAAGAAPSAEQALLSCVAARAAEESGWTDLNAAYLAKLRAGIGETPLVELPFVFTEEFARPEVERLSRTLDEGLGEPVRVVSRRRS
jgi:anion-transporting  ArsA/GET3 family ATPase